MSSTEVNKLIEPYVDLGNLLLIDREPIDGLPDVNEEKLMEVTQKNAQYLFNKIWTLPRKVVQDATCAQLPECDYALPREKPIPKPKEPTKWEKFAKEKGITKTKKDKKIFDETTQEWKPRYGYRRADNDKKDWLIEIPNQADPYKDYFAERSDVKREQNSKQEFQRLKNKNIGLGPGPVETKSRLEIGHQLNRAKNATASMGKFQPALKGEKPPKNMGLKKKFEPNESSVVEEKKRQMEILDRLKSKKPKLAEGRFNAVNEHMKREEKRNSESTNGPNINGSKKKDAQRRVGRTSGRSKSKINSQQRFQNFKKSGFKSFKSKAGKATARGNAKGKGRRN